MGILDSPINPDDYPNPGGNGGKGDTQMTYSLAKQLKDAGFPQEHLYYDRSECVKCMSSNDKEPCVPTLEELISACGEDFLSLRITRGATVNFGMWIAQALLPDGTVVDSGWSKDPSRTVAALYIALNKKDG